MWHLLSRLDRQHPLMHAGYVSRPYTISLCYLPCRGRHPNKTYPQLPGVIHAWYIIASYPEPDYGHHTVAQDSEGGHVHAIIHEHDGRYHRCQGQQQHQQLQT
jgi:hypothetical protein